MFKAYKGCRALRAAAGQLNKQQKNKINRYSNKSRCRKCLSSFILKGGSFNTAAKHIKSFRYNKLRPPDLNVVAKRLFTVSNNVNKKLYNR